MNKIAQRFSFDSYVDDGGYTPDLYPHHEIAEGVEGGFDGVTDEHIERFHEQGYLPIHNALTGAEVQDVLAGLIDLISGKNPEFKGVQFEKSVRDILHTLSGEERWDVVRKLNYFVGYDERLTALTKHPKMLSVLARVIGVPPELFAHQAILKPPRVGREKPWHQDHAYFNLPMGTPIVSVWVSLDEATLENGCMHVIPGTHRQGPLVHFKRRDWQICDAHVPNDHVAAVPLKPGGCLLWHGLIHHGTPANTSPKRRRAVQLHYIPASVERTTSKERLAVFGSEGKDVTC